jgi:hypothetical protein
MATILSTKTSGVGGLSVTGDASGVLQLASANGTTAVTIDASQNVTFAGSVNTPNTFGFKNRIINGGMVIDQRNAGASVTPTADGTYTLDRWFEGITQSSKFSLQQSATAPTGFINSLLCTSLSAYTVASGDIFGLVQKVEGLNISDLGWGTANAATVTLSFWVRSSLTGTFGGSIRNSAQNRSYPFSYSISSANTWEQKSVTIVGDTSGTWLTTKETGIMLSFGLGVGSTYSGTAGSWSANNYASATGAVSVAGTSGATWYVTGVQLEKGSVATSFDYRPYGTELSLCQRYYRSIALGFQGVIAVSGSYGVNITGLEAMRALPTLTWVNSQQLNGFANSTGGTFTTSTGVVYYKIATGATSNGSFIDQVTLTAEL